MPQKDPQGKLTGVQLEIMQALWDAEPDGGTVAEIREAIQGDREVARTTVLTLVTRLLERHWLRREQDGRSWRYFPQLPRDEAVNRLTSDFLDEYFNGSPSDLIKSLLGSERISGKELERARKILQQAKRKGKQP